jgi:hypothetical protein
MIYICFLLEPAIHYSQTVKFLIVKQSFNFRNF